MAKIDPVPWNVYIRAANDLDVDDLIVSLKQQLSEVLPPTVEQLSTLFKRLDRRERDEPSCISDLASNGMAVLTLLARLELLERLKDHMTPRPPVVLSEAEATRIADARWKDFDRPYDEWDFGRAMSKLIDDKIVKLRRLPKTQGCRYTFTKPPAKYPNAYQAFRRTAEYYQADLGYEGTAYVGLWANARRTLPRVVVTADIAPARRKQPPEPEPPLDPP